MRTREEIKEEQHEILWTEGASSEWRVWRNTSIVIELLLDIRDLLTESK